MDPRTVAENTSISMVMKAPGIAEVVPTAVETIPTPAGPVKPTKVALDDMARELEDLAILQKMIDDAEARKEEIRKKISDRIGENGIGTLNGRDIWAYSATQKLAGKRLKTDYPQLVEQFTHPRLVQEFNVEEFAKAFPSIHAEYLVRSLRPLGPKS